MLLFRARRPRAMAIPRHIACRWHQWYQHRSDRCRADTDRRFFRARWATRRTAPVRTSSEGQCLLLCAAHRLCLALTAQNLPALAGQLQSLQPLGGSWSVRNDAPSAPAITKPYRQSSRTDGGDQLMRGAHAAPPGAVAPDSTPARKSKAANAISSSTHWPSVGRRPHCRQRSRPRRGDRRRRSSLYQGAGADRALYRRCRQRKVGPSH